MECQKIRGTAKINLFDLLCRQSQRDRSFVTFFSRVSVIHRDTPTRDEKKRYREAG